MPIKVFDFFSGCGGSSRGFQEAGLEIVFALDSDADAKATFESNIPGVHFEQRNIRKFTPDDLLPHIAACDNHPRLFCGCAPCQPFTKQKTTRKHKDERVYLLNRFQDFVERFTPEVVFVENVPGMQKVTGKDDPFGDFVETLHKLEYHTVYHVKASQEYGVPQTRRRLVLMASRLGPISFPDPTHGPGTRNENYSTVREWIGNLPAIQAGETHPDDPMHTAAGLSDLNLRRIEALAEGEDRRNWPDELKLKCHTNGHKGHTDVYGRMWWDRPASGLTTRCNSLSNGRFGHPSQHRAISIREAALLQTFPSDYFFEGNLGSMARQIGNAVPVLLARRFGEEILRHVTTYFEGDI